MELIQLEFDLGYFVGVYYMKKLFKMTACLFIFFQSFALLAQTSVSEKSLDEEYQELVELFMVAARVGNNEVIDKFIDSGFPINQQNAQSYTALMVAAYNGQRESVKLLLDLGANACIQDKRGHTALMGALIKRELRIAKDLYLAKCSDNITTKSGLNLKEFAAMFGQSKELQQIIDDSNLVSKN